MCIVFFKKIFLLIPFFFSCMNVYCQKVYTAIKYASGENNIYSETYTESEVRNLKKKVLQEGDVNAYGTLQNIFTMEIDSLCKSEFMYSLVMANKYNNSHACLDIYYEIMNWYEKNKLDMDTISLNMALHYLFRAYELDSNNFYCISALFDLYNDGKYVTKDEKKAQKYADALFAILRKNKEIEKKDSFNKCGKSK